MRIWHQSMAPLGEFGSYPDVLRRHLAAVLPDDVVVDLHGSRPGSYLGDTPAGVLRYPAVKHLIQSQIFDHCLAAEDAGYDAIALASFGEPFLTEIRSLVDIPIASMPEAALHVGCTYARQIALVTLTPRSVPRLAPLVADHGLESRVAGIFALEPSITEAELLAALDGDTGPAAIVDSFADCARRALDAGADLVIPAEGVLNEVLWANGVTDIDGITVLDGVTVVMNYAVMMVRLAQTAGIGPARATSYPRADRSLVDAALAAARAPAP